MPKSENNIKLKNSNKKKKKKKRKEKERHELTTLKFGLVWFGFMAYQPLKVI